MWIIAGLGNPGIRYKWNRHNIGFFVVDLLSGIHGIRMDKKKVVSGLGGEGTIGKEEVLLLKPATYMNRSGVAVRNLSRQYGLSPQHILVISDDIDLPWGKIRIRKKGSSAGHRGVGSIINELGTENFPRLRMGIGRSGNPDVVGHVLGNFSKEERKGLKGYCMRAVNAIYTMLNNNIDTAMNKFN